MPCVFCSYCSVLSRYLSYAGDDLTGPSEVPHVTKLEFVTMGHVVFVYADEQDGIMHSGYDPERSGNLWRFCLTYEHRVSSY